MTVTIGDALLYIAANRDKLKKDLDDTKQETEGWLGQIGIGIQRSLGDALVRGVGRGIQAVAGLGKAVIDYSIDSQKAVGILQSELGTTSQEAQILGDIAGQVWKNNFGNDVMDAAQTVGQVRQQLKQLNAEGIQGAAQMALALRDAFGPQTQETIDAARTLTEDFNLTYQQAFDFIAAGYQKGLNRSGDFLDSITEYAPQFHSAQASAGEFFSAMETGLQGGMLGTDRALDMFKEFRVRLLDGSATTADGLKRIGLSVDDISGRINDGSLTWTDAFTLVQDKLRATGDQTAVMQAGVALLGTQFEDMGVQAALGVDLAATSLDELAGAAESVNVRYNNLGDFFQGMGRRLTVALAPAGDALLEIANDAMPEIEAGFKSLEAAAVPFAVGLAAIFKGLAGVAKAAFGGFRKETNDELGSTADDAGAWGRNIAIQLARGIAAAGVAVIQALKSIGNIISHWLAPGSPPRLLPQIDQWGTAAMQEFLDGMGEASVGALRSMGGRIMATLGGIQEAGLVGLFSTISGTVQRLMQSTAQEDDQGLIGRIMGSRGVIAQAVQDIQQYGQVSADTLAGIQQAMVGLPAVANDYVAAMLRLYEANQAVTAAQENLNAVTQQYDDQLRPLREELEGIQDAQADEADQRRIAQLQRAIARGALNDEQRAQAEREIRARQLAMQIRAIEEERDTAVDSAQDQLDAAEEQQRAAQAAVDLQQALIDANLENNSLIAEQVSLLQRLADAMSAIGPAIGDAISDALGDGLAASLGDGLDLGEVLDTGDDPLGLSSILDDMDIQGLVDEILAEFAPLQEEAEGLGGIFGGISENWDSLTEKANPLVEGLKLVAGGFAAIKVGGLAVSLLSTVGGFLSAGGAAGGFGASLLALAGPVGIIAAVIAGLAVLVATDFMGIRTTSEQLVFIIEWFFTVKIPEAIEAAGAAIQAWADNTRAWLSAAGQSAATWAASLGATVKGAFLELYNNAATALSQLWAIIQYYFWSAVNTASTAATQLVQIVLFNLQQLLANALTAGTQLVEIIRFAFWWVLNTASQAATQLVLFLFIKWNQIKAKTLELKKYIAERFQEVVDWFKDVGEKAGEMAETIQTAAGNAKDFINGLWDAIKGFWEWLKGKVFDFHINIPQLPDWATPGSPIPLHTAWKNFAEDMNGLVIKPEMDLPTAVPMPGAPGVGAPTLAPAAAGARTVQILGDIQLADDTAVDAFLAWLSTLQDADALGGTALVYGG